MKPQSSVYLYDTETHRYEGRVDYFAAEQDARQWALDVNGQVTRMETSKGTIWSVQRTPQEDERYERWLTEIDIGSEQRSEG
jgi:hypothetical protein